MIVTRSNINGYEYKPFHIHGYECNPFHIHGCECNLLYSPLFTRTRNCFPSLEDRGVRHQNNSLDGTAALSPANTYSLLLSTEYTQLVYRNIDITEAFKFLRTFRRIHITNLTRIIDS